MIAENYWHIMKTKPKTRAHYRRAVRICNRFGADGVPAGVAVHHFITNVRIKHMKIMAL